MDDMRAAWRDGDSDSLIAQLIELMETDYPDMYQALLVERNNRWIPVILKYFSTDDIEFVLVGAAHLVGKDGLLETLESAGYSIEQL